MKQRLFALIGALLLLTGCGGGLEPDASGALSPTESVPDAGNPDAAAYAADLGISLEEAVQRLSSQEGIGAFQERLRASLPDTFAGLWIEHQPAYRVMVALTEGDRASLEPLLAGQPFAGQVSVVPAAYSYRRLEADQLLAGEAAQSAAAAVTHYIDVQNNRIVIEVANPELFLNDITAGGYTLPESVSLQQMAVSQREPASNRGAVVEALSPAGATVWLPLQPPTNMAMAALMQGSLRLVDGCLRVAAEGDEQSFLVIWPNDTRLEFQGETAALLNGEGQLVARAGDAIRLGGGADESAGAGERLAELIPGMPIPGCPGPYWIAAPLETAAQQAVPDIYSDAFTSGGLLAQFIYQSIPAEAEGEISGELTLDAQKCIRVAGYTVLWPPKVWPREAPLRLVWEGEIPLAAFGDVVRIPGAEKGPGDYRYFENKIPCPGPYWAAADVLPAE